jgi:hypothetical protein
MFILAQFIQTEKTNPQVDKSLEIQTQKQIKTILRNACYDCHSNETKWPWYSKIAPLSWTITAHVNDARSWVNYSIWNTYTQEQKDKKLKETFRAIYAPMPPSSYIQFHPNANLTPKQRKIVRDWIKSLGKH